jgi:hypothetical protein
VIFETLWEAAQRGELLLIEGDFCHWHLRRDGGLVIREIIATRPGAGSEMLARLKEEVGALFLIAKCPADLAANDWYRKRGFTLAGQEKSQRGRSINVWRLDLDAGLFSEPLP